MNYFDEKIFKNTIPPELISFKDCEFINCVFELIDFSNMNLSLAKFIDCKFVKCNLSNVSVKNATFRDVNFSDCKLIGIIWSECVTLSSPVFRNSLLDFCVFQSMKLKCVIFENCTMKEVDFYETDFSKSFFTGSDLHKTNFSKANLASSDFRDAHDYFINIKDTNVKNAKFNLPEALSLLSNLDIILE
jgi:uncharacterized protein YjbI with pentapeptide repeats